MRARQSSLRARVSTAAIVGLAVVALGAAPVAAAGGHGGRSGGGHSGGGHSSGGHSGGNSGGHGGRVSSGHSSGRSSGHSVGRSGGYSRGYATRSRGAAPHVSPRPSSHGRTPSGAHRPSIHFGHRGSHVASYGHSYYGFPYYGYPYYGYGRYSGWGYGYGRPRYPGYAVPYGGTSDGALDLDVSPATTGIYVDGDYYGTVDDFDGFPSYLWLPPGEVEVVFFLDGYQTLVRRYRVVPGQVLGVEEHLAPGRALLPWESTGAAVPPAGAAAVAPSADLRQRTALLALQVRPSDAVVYLDGAFVGTGAELASGLTIDSGRHLLEVIRPGLRDAEWTIDAAPGAEIRRSVTLEPR